MLFSRSTGRFPTTDLSLHGINIPRNWPTGVGTDVPIRHVWHSCRLDLKDILCKYHGIEDLGREKDHALWLKATAAAVADGSGQPSSFFHVSRDVHEGHYFAELGRQRYRGETYDDQIFTRIDLLAMHQDAVIDDHISIDISSRPAKGGKPNWGNYAHLPGASLRFKSYSYARRHPDRCRCNRGRLRRTNGGALELHRGLYFA